MKSIVQFLVIAGSILTITSCTSNNAEKKDETTLASDSVTEASSDYLREVDMNEDSLITDMLAAGDTTVGCGYKNGTYPASVSYQNIKTEQKQELNMQVEVQNCQVMKVFSSDKSKSYEIRPADLDAKGTTTTLEGKDGTIYEVKILK